MIKRIPAIIDHWLYISPRESWVEETLLSQRPVKPPHNSAQIIALPMLQPFPHVMQSVPIGIAWYPLVALSG